MPTALNCLYSSVHPSPFLDASDWNTLGQRKSAHCSIHALRCWCIYQPSSEELVQKWGYAFQVISWEHLFHMFWALLVIFNIIIDCVIQLFLYLSPGQRGWENESLQIFSVKHTASRHSISGIIHHDFFPGSPRLHRRNDHIITRVLIIGPTQGASVHVSPSLIESGIHSLGKGAATSLLLSTSAVGLNQKWTHSVAAGLLSA